MKHTDVITASLDRALAQAVSRRLGTVEAPVQSQAIRVEFVVDEVALRQVFHRILRFSSVSIVAPMLHTHSSITGTI